MDEDIQNLIKFWVEHGSNINELLKKIQFDNYQVESENDIEFLSKSEEINKLIETSKLKQDLVLFRGIGIEEYYKILPQNLSVDLTLFYKREAFLPSSTDFSEAIKFAGKVDPDLGKALLCFKFNNGDNAISIDPTYIHSIDTILDEKEILLPLESYLQVLEYETKSIEKESKMIYVTFIYCNILYYKNGIFNHPILTNDEKDQRITELKQIAHKQYEQYMDKFDLTEWNKPPL